MMFPAISYASIEWSSWNMKVHDLKWNDHYEDRIPNSQNEYKKEVNDRIRGRDHVI